jgi:hypothetical protein
VPKWAKASSAVLIAIALAPGPAEAQVAINPYFGALFFDDSGWDFLGLGALVAVDTSAIVGARVVVPIARSWEIEGAYGYASPGLEPNGFLLDPGPGFEIPADSDVPDLDVHIFYGAINYLLGPQSVTTKFLLSAGLGGMRLSGLGPVEENGSTADFMATFGVGVTQPLADRITLRGELRDHIVFCEEHLLSVCLTDETLNHFELSGGLEIWLN